VPRQNSLFWSITLETVDFHLGSAWRKQIQSSVKLVYLQLQSCALFNPWSVRLVHFRSLYYFLDESTHWHQFLQDCFPEEVWQPFAME